MLQARTVSTIVWNVAIYILTYKNFISYMQSALDISMERVFDALHSILYNKKATEEFLVELRS